MKYLVYVTGDWYLRDGGSGGGASLTPERKNATRYDTEAAARAALNAEKKRFKPATVASAEFIPVEE